MAMLVGQLGGRCRVAHDGVRGIREAVAYRPDLVLLDIGMPGMDGYEVARRLRSHREHADALLVALTGWSYPQDHARSRAAGFDHHLRKPADVDELMALLASVEPAPRPPARHRAGGVDPPDQGRRVAGRVRRAAARLRAERPADRRPRPRRRPERGRG